MSVFMSLFSFNRLARPCFTALAAVLLLQVNPAQAGRLPEVEAEFKQVVADFEDLRVAGRTERALDALLVHAVQLLAEKGKAAEAEEISHGWMNMRGRLALAELGALDLGDHDPLNQWLAKTYAKLEGWLGTEILEFFRLDDIKILDYGIPVVFSPSRWDAKEYKLHFVPFSAAVTYWSSRLTCTLATTGVVSWFCGTIAEIPRWAVKRWVGPWLSDKVHSKFSGSVLAQPEALPSEDLGSLLDLAQSEMEFHGVASRVR